MVLGRALAPSGSLPAGVVVKVSVEGYTKAGVLVASGSVQSGGFGGYRLEAKPTRAFGHAALMKVSRLVVKLSENGVVVDSNETLVSTADAATGVSSRDVVADGRSFDTRDLHG